MAGQDCFDLIDGNVDSCRLICASVVREVLRQALV